MSNQTLRVLMPQWQGGDNPHYSLGAELLAWLAPNSGQPLVRVPVRPPGAAPLANENGVYGRTELLEQLDAADHLIRAHQPDRVVMFGGDCLVEQAPFAYLNERYDGELGLIWIDAHSDLVQIDGYNRAHTLPLGNLLGEGDAEFAKRVKKPLKPENIFIAGLSEPTPEEGAAIGEAFQRLGISMKESDTAMIDRLGIRTADARETANGTDSIKDWIRSSGIRHLAIHVDLDVLDPHEFRSLLFANPHEPYTYSPPGRLTLARLAELLRELSAETDVVGLGFTEHMPWDAIHLKKMLAEIPILNG